jgi:hypothetical protein
MESTFTGPGVVNFIYRGIVWDPQAALFVHVGGLPVQMMAASYGTTSAAGVAISAGEHTVRWEFRRERPSAYPSPYVLLDGVTFVSGPDISAALDTPDRGWIIGGTVSTGMDGSEDVALLNNGSISTSVEGPATVAFRWRATGSLNVFWNSGSFAPPGAGTSWQNARLVLPAGFHHIQWNGSGLLDAVSITRGAPVAEALELRGIDWRALFLTGEWDSVGELNRLGGTVMRSRLSAPGSNRLSLFFHQSVALPTFDWRRTASAPGASSFSASVQTSPAIAPATDTWSTGFMPILNGWRELIWTHTSTTGTNEEARLDAVTTSAESYFRWASARGLGHLPQDADSDGDGVANVLEFATGSDPADVTSATLPLPAFEPQPGGTLRIHWAIPPTAYPSTGLRWFLRSSIDLNAWLESPITTTNDGSIVLGAGYQSREFYQLRAEHVP